MDEEQNIPGDERPIAPEATQHPIPAIVNETALQGEAIVPEPQPITDSNTPVMEVHKHPHHVTHKKELDRIFTRILYAFSCGIPWFFGREHIVNILWKKNGRNNMPKLLYQIYKKIR
jgi:hypothetical protein